MWLIPRNHHHHLPLLVYLSLSAPTPNHTHLPPTEIIHGPSILAFPSTPHHQPIQRMTKFFCMTEFREIQWLRYKVQKTKQDKQTKKTFPNLNRIAVTLNLFLFNAFHLFHRLVLYLLASSQLIEKSLERPYAVKAPHLQIQIWIFWEKREGPNGLHIIHDSPTSNPFCSQLKLVSGDICELDEICSANQICIECPLCGRHWNWTWARSHPKKSCPYFPIWQLWQVDLTSLTTKVKFVR